MCISNAGLSNRHAQIWLEEDVGAYLIKDLGSESGTWIKVRKGVNYGEAVVPGAEFAIGPYVFQVEIGEDINLVNDILLKYGIEDQLLEDLNLATYEDLVKLDLGSLEAPEEIKDKLSQMLDEVRNLKGPSN